MDTSKGPWERMRDDALRLIQATGCDFLRPFWESLVKTGDRVGTRKLISLLQEIVAARAAAMEDTSDV